MGDCPSRTIARLTAHQSCWQPQEFSGVGDGVDIPDLGEAHLHPLSRTRRSPNDGGPGGERQRNSAVIVEPKTKKVAELTAADLGEFVEYRAHFLGLKGFAQAKGELKEVLHRPDQTLLIIGVARVDVPAAYRENEQVAFNPRHG